MSFPFKYTLNFFSVIFTYVPVEVCLKTISLIFNYDFVYGGMCTCTLVQIPVEVRRGCRISGARVTGGCRSMLRTELRSLGRAANTHDHGVTSPRSGLAFVYGMTTSAS